MERPCRAGERAVTGAVVAGLDIAVLVLFVDHGWIGEGRSRRRLSLGRLCVMTNWLAGPGLTVTLLDGPADSPPPEKTSDMVARGVIRQVGVSRRSHLTRVIEVVP